MKTAICFLFLTFFLFTSAYMPGGKASAQACDPPQGDLYQTDRGCFEAGLTYGWEINTNNGGSAISNSTSQYHLGSHSLKLTTTTTGGNTEIIRVVGDAGTLNIDTLISTTWAHGSLTFNADNEAWNSLGTQVDNGSTFRFWFNTGNLSTNLTVGESYTVGYWYMLADDGKTIYLDDISIVQNSEQPLLSNLTLTALSSSSAEISIDLDPNNAPTTLRTKYGTSISALNDSITFSSSPYSSIGTYKDTLIDLTPNTKYYISVSGTSSEGYSVTPIDSETTLSSGPQTYYFSDSDGNDANDGLSPSSPKQTLVALKTLVNSASSGDQFLLKSGDTWTNSNVDTVINLEGKSGTGWNIGSEVIYFGRYGTGTNPKLYIDTCKVVVNFYKANYIIWRAIDIEGNHDTTNKNLTANALFECYGSGYTQRCLWIDSCDLGYSESIIIINNQYQHDLRVTNSTLHNTNVSYENSTGQGISIFGNADSLTVKHCTFTEIGIGTSSNSTAHTHYIYGSNTTNTAIDSNVFIRGDSVLSCQNAISLPDAYNAKIRGNLFQDFYAYGVLINSRTSGGIWGYTLDSVLISGNQFINVGLGIWSAGGDCNVGYNRKVWIENNIFNCTKQFTYPAGIWVECDSIYDYHILHNTFINCYGGAVYTGLAYWMGNSEIKNNIFYNDAFSSSALIRIVDDGVLSKWSFDYNIYYKTVGDFFQFGWSYTPMTLSTFKSTYSQESNSINSNPLFISPTDFHLNESSPAANAGIDVGIIIDLEGNSRDSNPDIGAYEYSISGPDTLPSLSSLTLTALSCNSIEVSVHLDPHSSPATLRAIYGTSISALNDSITFSSSPYSSVNTYKDTIYGLTAITEYYIKVSGTNSTGYAAAGPDSATTLSTSSHFTKIWTDAYLPMNIYVTSAKIDGIDLGAGDEIAVFDGNNCVGLAVLNAPIPGDSSLSIIASTDDPTTPGVDGFVPNNPITYKFWDSEGGLELDSISANYSAGDGTFNSLETAVVELNGTNIITITQEILLTKGWNIFSLKAEPVNPNMLQVLDPLITSEALIKAQDEDGNAVENIPPWTNNIGNFSPTEGYYIKVDTAATLSVTGVPVELPLNIPLDSGWNIISYPIPVEQNSDSLLQALIAANQLIKVQDEEGNAIEQLPAPIGWINDIGQFQPGKGYYFKTNTDTSLTLNEPTVLIAKTVSQSKKNKTTTTHFQPQQTSRFLPINIYINQADLTGGTQLSAGDEIGIFDGTQCIAAAALNGSINPASPLSMIASMDDPSTPETDGYVQGHTISYKFWISSLSAEIMEYTANYSVGNGTFTSQGTALVSFTNLTAEAIPTQFELYQNYPNPFNPVTNIKYALPYESSVELVIYDIIGRVVKSFNISLQPVGYQNIVWDGTNENGIQVSSGVYIYRINAKSLKNHETFVKSAKMMILK